jgi:GAF domain-containing protein
MSMPESTPERPRGSAWRRILFFLVHPSDSLSMPEEQKKAQAASLIALAVGILATAAFIVAGTRQGQWGLAIQEFGPFLVITWGSYLLTRTRIYVVGAFVFVLGLCSVPLFSLLGGTNQDVVRSPIILIPLGLILGSYLLSPRGMALLVGILAAEILSMPIAGVRLATGDSAALAITVGMGLALIVIASLRNRELEAHRERLVSATAEIERMQRQLEQRVTERTEALNRRTAQLEAASFVSRQTAAILGPARLLDEVVHLISDRFGYYHAGIFLLDTRGHFAVLQAASSEGGQRMLARGHRLEVGREGIVGYAAYQKRARIALDVGEEAVFFSNSDLPDTRSEMALPLVVRDRVLGVMDIQSTEPGAFAEEDISALQTLADQIALALDNAQLLAESQTSLQQLQALTTESSLRAWRERLGAQKTAFRYTPTGVRNVDGDAAGARQPANDDFGTLRVPINLRGKEIGTIAIHRKGQGQEWSDTDRSLVAEVSAQVALALDNARLLEDLQQRARREGALARAASRFSQTTDMETLIQLALREFHQLPSVEEVAVVLQQAENGHSTG